MLRFLAITTLAACGFDLSNGAGITPVDADPDALGTEAGVDAPTMVDAPPAVSCHGGFELVCLSAAPLSTIDVTGGGTFTVDTDASTACGAPAAGSSITSACILAAATVNINGTLRATGSKPLILIGTISVTVNGGALIDVSSRGLERGAGARSCPISSGASGNDGGYGASFKTSGGMGGPGGAGSPGPSPSTSALTDLVGGCNGAPGGGTGVNGGAGGAGGGAVLLIGPSVIINGTINASGGGGSGGALASAGGGGGGSGGSIVIDSPNFAFNGGSFLYAQGGGGGEGASLTTAGANGGVAQTPGSAALGGRNVNGQGGDGGNGAISSDGSAGNSGNDGGGGGGGGAGHIFTTDSNVNASGMAFPALDN